MGMGMGMGSSETGLSDAACWAGHGSWGYHHLEGGVARVVDAQRREPRLVRVVLLARLALVLALGVVDGARGDEDGDHHEEEDRRELRKVGV